MNALLIFLKQLNFDLVCTRDAADRLFVHYRKIEGDQFCVLFLIPLLHFSLKSLP